MLKNSIIYMLAEIMNKGVPFLLLPVLTKYLTPYDYGIIASFSSFVGFVTIFISLSVHGAINVNFFKLTRDKLRLYISNAVFLLLIMLGLLLFIVFLFHVELSQQLLLSSEWLYLGVVTAVSQTITLINLTLWLSEKKPREYSIYQIMQTFLISFLSILMIIAYEMHWKGQLIAIIVGSISFSVFSMYCLQQRNYLQFIYDKSSIKDLLHFGIPLIPHQLSGWITRSGDRLLLIALLGANVTGLFSVGYQIGMIMSVIVTAFHKAWNPFIYEKLSKGMNDLEKQTIVKYMYFYFILIILLVFILNTLGFYIFKYWIDVKFMDSYKYVIYVLIEYGLNGMYFMVVSYIFYFKKTKQLAVITFIASLVHLLLSYTFIHIYGAIGVAYSGIISYFIMFISVFWYAQTIYPLPLVYWNRK